MGLANYTSNRFTRMMNLSDIQSYTDTQEAKIENLQQAQNSLKDKWKKFLDDNRKDIRKIIPQVGHVWEIRPINYEHYIEDGGWGKRPVIEEIAIKKVKIRKNTISMRAFGYNSLLSIKTAYLTDDGKILSEDNDVPIQFFIRKIEEPLKNQEKTKVYLMIDGYTGLYKIGKSKNPSIREKTLLSQTPMLKLLKYWDATGSDEFALHDKFKKQRMRGEWFRLTARDIKEIESYFENKCST